MPVTLTAVVNVSIEPCQRGAAVVSIGDWIAARFSPRPAVAHAIFFLVVLFAGIRFGRFDLASVRSQVKWTQEWRVVADDLTRRARPRPSGGVAIDARGLDVKTMYVEPMLRWIDQDYTLSGCRRATAMIRFRDHLKQIF